MINGLMMLISFFLCRVMIFPVLYWWYSTVMDMSLLSTVQSIPMWVNLATLGLWLPQLIWFYKMLKGSLKVIKDRQKHISKTEEISLTDNSVLVLDEYNKKVE